MDSYKYLRILLSSGLSWTQHIQSTCGKARKLISLIYQHFYQCSNSESLFQMYISLVRPHLEYASQVWNPNKAGEINSLEDVQKFALRMCAKHWDSGYDDLLQLFSLSSLQQHRLYLDLSTMFKIVHGLFYFHQNKYAELLHLLSKLPEFQGHSHTNYLSVHMHTCFYNSFVPRTIRNWNMFTAHVPLSFSSSISSFKTNFWAYMQN